MLIWDHKLTWKKPLYDLQIWLVKTFTQSSYSHVGVAYWVNNRLFTIDATGIGVALRPLSEDKPDFLLRRPKQLSEVSIDWSFQKIGQHYSKWQAIMAYLGKLKGGSDSKWECAEFVNLTYRTDEEHFNSLTPSKIIDEAMSKWNADLIKIEHT